MTEAAQVSTLGTGLDEPDQRLGLISKGLYHLSNLHRRMLVVYFALLGPRLTYGVMARLARWLYRLLDPIRLTSEAQCGPALAGVVAPERIKPLAEKAFVHRVWDLADLMLADRFMHAGTFRRYGVDRNDTILEPLLDAQRRRQPAILLTGYYGPFDMLPLLLGFHGVRAGIVYKRHGNRAFDAYRARIRGRSGTELIPVELAATRCESILEAGGAVGIVADHHAGPRGMPVTFLGLPTRALRSVGLLACRYDADVVVAGIRRVHDGFRFELLLEDVIRHTEWRDADDPVAFITERYLRGLERIIRADPAQYLWAQARWGEEYLRKLIQATGSDAV